MKSRFFTFAALLIMAMFLVAACNSTAAPEPQQEPEQAASEAEPQQAAEEEAAASEAAEPEEATAEDMAASESAGDSGESNVISIAHSEYAFTFDPAFCNWSDVSRICVVAYDPLIKYDPETQKVIPWVAKSWEVSDDGKTYTFDLTEGIKFHDGTDLTASDVKYSIERLIAVGEGVASNLEAVESVEVVDDYTVAIHLNIPSGAFLLKLAPFFIINEDGAKANEVDGDLAQEYLTANDLGSGPYQLVNSIPEEQAIFKRFDDYWQGWAEGQIEGINFLWVKEWPTQRLMLENGELDIAMEPSVDDLAKFEASPDYQVLKGQSPVILYVAFRVTHPPLDDIRVRKALAMAIDYDTFIEFATAGYGKRAPGPLASVLPYYDDDLPLTEYNLDAAKKLLDEAGYADGFTLQVVYESAQEEKQRLLENLQANWGQLGVELEPVGVDYVAEEAMQQDENSEPDVYLTYMWPSAADPDAALREYFHSDLKGVFGSNASFWSDPEVDRLLDEGLVESDPAKRNEIYREIQQIIVDNQPAAWVAEDSYNIVARNRVKGYVYNPALHQSIDVYHMRLEDN